MTTANILDTVQSALRDRMEVIRLPATPRRELEIAYRHLLPKQMDENGITPRDLNISRTALTAMIQRYTHEADSANSKERSDRSAASRAPHREIRRAPSVSRSRICMSSGRAENYSRRVLKKTRLRRYRARLDDGRWDVLFVEALRIREGQSGSDRALGEIMRESAQAAYSYAKCELKSCKLIRTTLAV